MKAQQRHLNGNTKQNVKMGPVGWTLLGSCRWAQKAQMWVHESDDLTGLRGDREAPLSPLLNTWATVFLLINILSLNPASSLCSVFNYSRGCNYVMLAICEPSLLPCAPCQPQPWTARGTQAGCFNHKRTETPWFIVFTACVRRCAAVTVQWRQTSD